LRVNFGAQATIYLDILVRYSHSPCPHYSVIVRAMDSGDGRGGDRGFVVRVVESQNF